MIVAAIRALEELFLNEVGSRIPLLAAKNLGTRLHKHQPAEMKPLHQYQILKCQMHKCQMHKCQMRNVKCTNVETHKFANAEMKKLANAQIQNTHNFSTQISTNRNETIVRMPTPEMSNAKCEMHKCLNAKMLKCSNVQCTSSQMPIIKMHTNAQSTQAPKYWMNFKCTNCLHLFSKCTGLGYARLVKDKDLDIPAGTYAFLHSLVSTLHHCCCTTVVCCNI